MTDNPNVYQGQLGTDRPNDVQISADGTKVYAAGADGNLYVYSAATGELLHTWDVGTQLGGMDISPDGSFAIVVELAPFEEHYADPWWDTQTDVTVYKVDLTTGEVTGFPITLTGDEYGFFDVAILDNGNALLTEQIFPGWSGWAPMRELNLSTGEYTVASGVIRHNSILSDSADGHSALVAQYNTSDAPLNLYQSGAGIVETHAGYADGVYGFNDGVQAFNEQAGLVAQGLGQQINIYNGELQYQLDLTQLLPELGTGGISGLAFDASGQYLFVLNDGAGAIYQVSTSDWSVVGAFSVSGGLTVSDGDFGNRLLVSPDMSYFTVVTDHGLVMVDPTVPTSPTTGDDSIFGTSDSDTIDALAGNDLVNGFAGDDDLRGSSGFDHIAGGDGADLIRGGDDNDWLYAAQPEGDTGPFGLDHGTEHDVLFGDAGDDVLSAGYGDDVDGGTGTDTLRLNLAGSASGITLDATKLTTGQPIDIGGGTIQSVEQLEYLGGTDFDDHLTVEVQPIPLALTVEAGGGDDFITSLGGDGNVILHGNDGNDRFDIYGGSATIYGDAGSDEVFVEGGQVYAMGGAGDDYFVSGTWADAFDGGEGSDTVSYLLSSIGVTVNLSTGATPQNDYLYDVENLSGSNFTDSLTGDAGVNHLEGLGGNDILDGGDGNDFLDGGVGNDTMRGGTGEDLYVVDSSRDVVTELSNAGNDLVLSSITYTLGNNVERGQLIGSGAINLTGNALNNSLDGNDAANRLSGGNGNDTLDGRGGADTMIGGAGNDTFIVDNVGDVVTEARSGGTDEVLAIVSYVLTTTSEVEKLTAAGDSAVNLTGNATAQTITGNGAANVLAGLGGADTLIGGGGNDTFLFGMGGGKDIITDFAAGDLLKVSGYAAALSVTQSGANVVVVFSSSDQITLQNTNVATVQAGLQFDTTSGGGGGGTPGGPTEGDDTLTGTTRGDTINGLGGNDTILGLAGADKLLGGAGNDTLRGGLGADTLTGGSGADLFVFEAGGGNDKVADFVSGTDKIDLHLLGITSSEIKTVLSNGNTVISIDADHNGRADFTITLAGVTHVDSGDFIFS